MENGVVDESEYTAYEPVMPLLSPANRRLQTCKL
jgi:hypothetical protein